MLSMGVNLPFNRAPSYNAGPQSLLDQFYAQQNASASSNQQLGQMFNTNSNQILAQLQAQSSQALRSLFGTNRANIRSIDRRFAQEQGHMTSDLINRGLGNATIQGSMNAGMTRAHADAISGSRAAFGEKMFGAQMQSALAQSGLASQQLNTFFNGTNIGYPDMGSLAAMMGSMGAGAAGGGGGMGGGSLLVGDASRPTGGPQPAWMRYAGGAPMDQNVGGAGGYDASLFGGSPALRTGTSPNLSSLYAYGGQPAEGYAGGNDAGMFGQGYA